MKSIAFAFILPVLLLLTLELPVLADPDFVQPGSYVVRYPANDGPGSFIYLMVRYPNGKPPPKDGPIFKAVREGRYLKVVNTKSGQTVWKTHNNPWGHGDDLLLYVAPGMKRMVLVHQYGVRGQTLYWVALGAKPCVFGEVPCDTWSKAATAAAGILTENIIELTVEFVRWESPNHGYLAWDLRFGGGEHEYFSGVLSVTFSKPESGPDSGNQPPVVKTGPQKVKMTQEESRKLSEAWYEPLIEAWRE